MTLAPNAYVEPKNPNAVFPQNKKPHILDFRAHKMAGSGFASIGNFRKMMSANSIKSKYADIIVTKEQMDAEEEMQKIELENPREIEFGSDEEVDINEVPYNINDLTKDMGK